MKDRVKETLEAIEEIQRCEEIPEDEFRRALLVQQISVLSVLNDIRDLLEAEAAERMRRQAI